MMKFTKPDVEGRELSAWQSNQMTEALIKALLMASGADNITLSLPDKLIVASLTQDTRGLNIIAFDDMAISFTAQ